MPVLLARIEEDAVAWANHVDGPAAPLRASDAFEDVDRLAVRMRMQAVRAPGVKWTLLALSRELSDGAATVSMYTAPVNQSLGPRPVSRLFLVICISFLSVTLTACVIH